MLHDGKLEDLVGPLESQEPGNNLYIYYSIKD